MLNCLVEALDLGVRRAISLAMSAFVCCEKACVYPVTHIVLLRAGQAVAAGWLDRRIRACLRRLVEESPGSKEQSAR